MLLLQAPLSQSGLHTVRTLQIIMGINLSLVFCVPLHPHCAHSCLIVVNYTHPSVSMSACLSFDVRSFVPAVGRHHQHHCRRDQAPADNCACEHTETLCSDATGDRQRIRWARMMSHRIPGGRQQTTDMAENHQQIKGQNHYFPHVI